VQWYCDVEVVKILLHKTISMKKLSSLLTVIIVISIFTVVACKKSSTTNPGTTPTTACNGKNLCFKMDGTDESHDAKWKVLSDRYRIYWEESSGSDYSNIEIDMYGTAVGKYTVAARPSAGQAGFQYYKKVGSTTKNIQGESGTIEITKIDGTKITGTFTVTAKDGSTTYQITEGNFVAVPQ
jgi:hypothetical protein